METTEKEIIKKWLVDKYENLATSILCFSMILFAIGLMMKINRNDGHAFTVLLFFALLGVSLFAFLIFKLRIKLDKLEFIWKHKPDMLFREVVRELKLLKE